MVNKICPICGSLEVNEKEDGLECENCGFSETFHGWDIEHGEKRHDFNRKPEKKRYIALVEIETTDFDRVEDAFGKDSLYLFKNVRNLRLQGIVGKITRIGGKLTQDSPKVIKQ